MGRGMRLVSAASQLACLSDNRPQQHLRARPACRAVAALHAPPASAVRQEHTFLRQPHGNRKAVTGVHVPLPARARPLGRAGCGATPLRPTLSKPMRSTLYSPPLRTRTSAPRPSMEMKAASSAGGWSRRDSRSRSGAAGAGARGGWVVLAADWLPAQRGPAATGRAQGEGWSGRVRRAGAWRRSTGRTDPVHMHSVALAPASPAPHPRSSRSALAARGWGCPARWGRAARGCTPPRPPTAGQGGRGQGTRVPLKRAGGHLCLSLATLFRGPAPGGLAGTGPSAGGREDLDHPALGSPAAAPATPAVQAGLGNMNRACSGNVVNCEQHSLGTNCERQGRVSPSDGCTDMCHDFREAVNESLGMAAKQGTNTSRPR